MKIFINGRNGKMGKAIAKIIEKSDNIYESSFEDCDVVIDFSSNEGLEQIYFKCFSCKTPLVSGTTGLSDAMHRRLNWAADIFPIFYSANFSSIYKISSCVLNYLYDNKFDIKSISITEIHHKSKKDKPSGTALELSNKIKEICGIIPFIISKRTQKKCCGEHIITINLKQESISFSHKAESRDVFAHGAIEKAVELFYNSNLSLTIPKKSV